MIHLEKVDKNNVITVIKIWDTLDSDQKLCVAHNAVSLAQAYAEQDRAWARVIYDDEEIVGFIMMALYDDDIPSIDQPAYYLWRFMIGKPFQTRGYGRQVLDIIYQKCLDDGIKYLYTSCMMHTPMPYKFYINYGFIDTGELDGEEEILKLKIVKR